MTQPQHRDPELGSGLIDRSDATYADAARGGTLTPEQLRARLEAGEILPTLMEHLVQMGRTIQALRTHSSAGAEALAEEMFAAYNDQGPNPWKTWDGKDVPRWPALSDQVRAKWAAAAHRALADSTHRSTGDLRALDVLGVTEATIV